MTLFELQEASYGHASPGILSSWPKERALGAEELAAFLDERLYCVLATASSRGRAQARPVAFVLFQDALWFGTGASGRLRNLEHAPWVSVVISEGEREQHRAVVADGPVTLTSTPSPDLLDAWEARFGSRPDWAVAWIGLRPERVYSYSGA